jgi:hypothetical protein
MSDNGSVRDYHDTEAVINEVQCTLTEREAAERADWVEEEFLPHLEGIKELDDGYVFVFPDTDDALQAVLLESRCCSDQGYTLEVPADGTDIRLTVTGPAGTKELAQGGFFEMFEDAPDIA